MIPMHLMRKLEHLLSVDNDHFYFHTLHMHMLAPHNLLFLCICMGKGKSKNLFERDLKPIKTQRKISIYLRSSNEKCSRPFFNLVHISIECDCSDEQSHRHADNLSSIFVKCFGQWHRTGGRVGFVVVVGVDVDAVIGGVALEAGSSIAGKFCLFSNK